MRFFLFFFAFQGFAQSNWSVAVQYHYGAILPHSNNILHLITDKPSGFLLSFNHRTIGDREWHHIYRFPDIGFSLHTQNNHNEILGDIYGLYAHYNFYFLNRRLQFRIAQGVAYATNPYDKVYNYRNIAYGTKFMPSTYFMFSYDHPKIWNNLGVNSGLIFMHHSNATIKSPNTSTNTVALTFGLSYQFSSQMIEYKPSYFTNHPEKMRYNLLFRTGVNESHIVGMGQKPFYHLAVIAERPFHQYGGVQFGADLFLSNSLKELIPFLAQSFPETAINADDDWKRVGLFLGYEWYLNRMTVEGNVGFYVYDKYKESGMFYQRLGLRYYITPAVFGIMSLKTHFAKAEAFELGLGYKL